MGLYNTVKFDDNLSENFKDDGFELNNEIYAKYENSVKKLNNSVGSILPRDNRFCKNAFVYDLSGKQISSGDLSEEFVKDWQGVYYIFSEPRTWSIPDELVSEEEEGLTKTPFRSLDNLLLDVEFIKSKAIARIVDGKIQTNEKIIKSNWQF